MKKECQFLLLSGRFYYVVQSLIELRSSSLCFPRAGDTDVNYQSVQALQPKGWIPSILAERNFGIRAWTGIGSVQTWFSCCLLSSLCTANIYSQIFIRLGTVRVHRDHPTLILLSVVALMWLNDIYLLLFLDSMQN